MTESGLDYLIGQVAPASIVPDKLIEVYIVSTVLEFNTHASTFPHCLQYVIGGYYADILDLRVLAIELVDISMVPEGDESLFTVLHCLESL